MTNKNIKRLLIIFIVLFVIWFFFFASVVEKASIIGAFGHLVGQIIVVSCFAALVTWYFKKKEM
jgi:hypothetical protein